MYVFTNTFQPDEFGNYQTIGPNDYPANITEATAKKKYEHLQYDPFGARRQYAGDPAEGYLHDLVDFGHLGMDFDSAAGGYVVGGGMYEPHGGRLMSPVGGGVNPYVFAGNSPVDRGGGMGRQQVGDNFKAAAGDYGHYAGWNHWAMRELRTTASDYVHYLNPGRGGNVRCATAGLSSSAERRVRPNYRKRWLGSTVKRGRAGSIVLVANQRALDQR